MSNGRISGWMAMALTLAAASACTIESSDCSDCDCSNCDGDDETGGRASGQPSTGGAQPSDGGEGNPATGGRTPSQNRGGQGGVVEPSRGGEGGVSASRAGAGGEGNAIEPSSGGEGGVPAAHAGAGGEGNAGPCYLDYELCDNGVDDDCNGAEDEVPCREVDACSYDGTELPTEQGWEYAAVGMETADVEVDITDGVLHVSDDSTSSGSHLGWGRDCFGSIDPGYVYVAEFRVRAVSATAQGGFRLGLGDGMNLLDLSLFPDDLLVGGSLGCDQTTVSEDLASEFATIRLELQSDAGTDAVSTFVDGALVNESTTTCTASQWEVSFGMFSTDGTGEGYVDDVRAWRERRQ
ncbi:MAG: hypothetical protein JW751_18355 [Polyangiaceae bacterium]|nr:hypothetical protein [Polyangiaceae bacterium]